MASRTRSISIVTCTLIGLTSFNELAAHHAVAGSYDTSRIIEVEGTVTDVLWRNPHVQVSFQGTDESGQESVWELATTSLSNMRRWKIAPELGIVRVWSTPDNIPVLIPRGFGRDPANRANLTQPAVAVLDAYVWERAFPWENERTLIVNTTNMN